MLKDKGLFWLAVFTAVMVMLSVVGGFINYSPIPHWDMWDGTLFFYHRAQAGEYGAWWAQHNEHRIVLARILFWIDYKFFAGISVFLTIVNYVLVAFTAWLFWIFIRQESPNDTPSRGEKILGLFLTAWAFLWTQEGNLTWAFQSQFFLGQSIPLFALYWLARSTTTRSRRDFFWACFFGVLSITTMANGVLALPLMLLYCLVMREGKAKTGVVLGLSIVCLAAYFNHYESPGHHGKLSDALRDDPVGLIEYTLLYLGSPFHYLSGKWEFGINKISASLAGGLLLILSAWIACKEVIKPKKSPKVVALLIFILYIAGTAFGTAGGRLILGMDLALSSRYTTPALMAFAALAIILAHLFRGRAHWFLMSRKRALAIALPSCALLLATQALALKPMAPVLAGRNAGALALALHVPDDATVKNTFYSTGIAMLLAKASQENHYTVFARPPYAGLLEQIDRPFTPPPRLGACLASSTQLEAVPGESRFLRISGWVHEAVRQRPPGFFRLVDGDNLTIGFGFAGFHKNDPAEPSPKRWEYSGFTGYVLARATGKKISIVADDPRCKADLQVPSTFLSPLAVDLATIQRDALGASPLKTSDVASNDGWTGGDFQRTETKAIRVLGSYRSSDADTGSITLHARDGVRFFFKSGPMPGGQYIELLDTGEKIMLPQMKQWSLLELSRPGHTGAFDIKLFDSGTAWGQWAAIAIESNE